MKWTVLNALGGVSWLAGLEYAKGADLAFGRLPVDDGHRLMIGGMIGLLGLSILLWTNVRNTA